MNFEYTKRGRLATIKHNDIMLNQLRVTDLDDHMINVYLRTEQKVVSLMERVTEKAISDKCASYRGMIENNQFTITFIAAGSTLNIEIDINYPGDFDFIFTIDLGLGSEGYLQSNEAYASQYLDHKVMSFEPLQIASRKTVEQEGKYPGVITSKLPDFVKFSTDGYQTFTSQYRDSKSLDNLRNDLANEVYQYEFAMLSLQSKKFNDSSQVKFSLCVIENVDTPESYQTAVFEKSEDVNLDYTAADFYKHNTVSGADLLIKEVERLYPNKQLVEDNELSFFIDNTHVVLKQKELLMERNHGHITLTGKVFEGNEEVLSNTMYMNGYFGGQISVGNTDFNQLLTPLKNSLNMNNGSGLRMYVEIDEVEYQLTTPSAFEMGLNYAKWIYKINDQLVEIRTYTSMTNNQIWYEVESVYPITVTMQFDMKREFELINDESITILPQNEYVLSKCPNLNYSIKGLQIVDKIEDNIYKFNLVSNKFSIAGSKYEPATHEQTSFAQEVAMTEELYSEFLNHFTLESSDKSISKFNQLTKWYVHNALVHYGTPRGLEQYVGAAWGTRDVLQGPLELFITLQKYDLARDVMKRVYNAQFDDGNWSQWFMFDEYIEVAAGESHGDVVVWPFKAIAYYVENTNDYSIFEEKVSYKLRTQPFTLTENKYTILDHLKTQWNYVQNNLLEGTSLPCYGDGDWDDTLQPKSNEQRKNMASGWTVTLLYESLTKLSHHLQLIDPEFATEINDYTVKLKADYFKYMVEDDICAGFIIKNGEEITKLLHPTDHLTGIQYRLLPINRGIISEVFDEHQVKKGLEIIDTKLKCNDGIRLMNKPANYNSGFNTLFKRAEQASTVGREVGLQYVHAHIRYVEAMSKLGLNERVLFGLNQIQPIDNNNYVKNTMLKQRNAYFSSSEGNFKTRYDFQENFEGLKDGSVAVKTGWRIYSSGPGIYLNQLIRNALGLKITANSIIIDPVLPESFENTVLNYKLFGKTIKFEYVKSESTGIFINDIEVKEQTSDEKYKDVMYKISKSEIENTKNPVITIKY